MALTARKILLRQKKAAMRGSEFLPEHCSNHLLSDFSLRLKNSARR